MSDRPVILASSHKDGVRLDPQSYLGSTFNAYREAVVRVGARYVPSLKANVISVDRLASLRDALAEAGFELAVAADLRGSLSRAAEESRALSEDGARRLAEAESRLKTTGLSLYPYQRDGVRWLAVRRAALLADTMGLGKTVQVLMALPPEARALVVAPAAVASNWVAESRRWRPDLEPSYLSGRADWRWPRPGELLVATYGSLPAEDQEMTLPPSGVYLVADEAHLLKGTRGRKLEDGTYKGGTRRVRRWFVARDAVSQSQGHVWLLTGTPLVNRPPELWRVLNAAGLATDAFGSYPRFTEMLGGRKGRFGTTYDGAVDAAVPLALQKVSLRRDREVVLPDLPRKRRQIQSVEIGDGDALRLCDDLVAALAERGETVDALADMSTLAKETREVVFEMLSRVRAGLAAAKIPALLEHVEEYEEEETRLVVFSAHLEPLRALAAREGWGLIDGSVPAEARAEVVSAFQAGRLRGIACSYAAGGVGITLTAAHHVLCVDLPWTPALLQQAEDRCCRIGQGADSVHVRVLAADHPVDMRVAELLLEKTAVIERTVEASAVEHVGVDDAVARQAEGLSDLAAATATLAAEAERAALEQIRDREAVTAGREARAAGAFTVGCVPQRGNFRPPKDDEECHAARAMVQLAGNDGDRAAVRNDVGFSRLDNEIGHSIAESLVSWGRLSDKQWYVAKKLAVKYRGQVGAYTGRPEEETNPGGTVGAGEGPARPPRGIEFVSVPPAKPIGGVR